MQFISDDHLRQPNYRLLRLPYYFIIIENFDIKAPKTIIIVIITIAIAIKVIIIAIKVIIIAIKVINTIIVMIIITIIIPIIITIIIMFAIASCFIHFDL